jgi:hypothetical protein
MEGIFRISGGTAEVAALKAMFNKGFFPGGGFF